MTAAINGAGTIVTGQGEAGATVTIRDPNAAVIGTATVAANGTYTAILTTQQLNAQLLQVTQADAAGNVAAPATVTAPDLTAPLAPAGTVSSNGTTLTGTGEAGATVTIRAPDGTIIATVLVAGDGSFTAALNPAQANGQLLTLTQADPAGNISPVAQAPAPDITAPVGLTAAINGAGTIVSGIGEAGATVTVRDALGNPLGTVVVAAGGTYAVTLTTPQANGEALNVAQADASGNISPAIPLTAPDITAPLAPAGTVSGDGTTLTGTGEAGATVTIRAPDGTVIATVLVAGDGSFTASLNPAQANGQLLTLTQADPTGNVSPVAQAPAPDITAPVGLTTAINGVGTIVSGTGEAGATVTVRDTLGNAIGMGTVATDGTYAVTLTTPQANGQALSVVQADATGNTSTPIPLAAPDITPPAVPTALVNGVGTVVNGTGEAGATVRILDPQGQLVGTAVVDANGSYTAALTTAQANGQVLSVTQVDPAGTPRPRSSRTRPTSRHPPPRPRRSTARARSSPAPAKPGRRSRFATLVARSSAPARSRRAASMPSPCSARRWRARRWLSACATGRATSRPAWRSPRRSTSARSTMSPPPRSTWSPSRPTRRWATPTIPRSPRWTWSMWTRRCWPSRTSSSRSIRVIRWPPLSPMTPPCRWVPPAAIRWCSSASTGPTGSRSMVAATPRYCRSACWVATWSPPPIWIRASTGRSSPSTIRRGSGCSGACASPGSTPTSPMSARLCRR
ncbi:Ig-like domain-containing protein [Sphingomonas sp. I4]